MILSNIEIINALQAGRLQIEPPPGTDPTVSPFNTSAVDLRLGSQILVPKKSEQPVQLDLRKPGIARFWAENSTRHQISEVQPYVLRADQFILGQTYERVAFPLKGGLSARVEGRSSFARCGIIVHFTAPTIHAGFEGTITLEMINFGPMDLLLYPHMFICQLIIEQVHGLPSEAPNQFLGQADPAGVVPRPATP